MAAKNKQKAPKGMNDIWPGAREEFLDSAIWDRIFKNAEEVFGGFGYRHVRFPVVEETGLFARGIGEGTDIVAKEMYSFEDRGGRPLTLRPEGTAGAVRAYVEHDMGRIEGMQRWWYSGTMFRAERPQKGRYRQFYQVGAELFGVSEPMADAELLAMLWRFINSLGLQNITLALNTLGDEESRLAYRTQLTAYLHEHEEGLCESCVGRLDTNPLRTLDCKREGCKEVASRAPEISESLSTASAEHFAALLRLLDGMNVSYTYDPRLVRGLDYYTNTVFEFTTGDLGSQNAIMGGGRYDGLVEELGGPSTPAIGFSAGVERLALLMAAQGKLSGGPELYIMPLLDDAWADEGWVKVFELAEKVRENGLRVEVDVRGGRLKQQMRRANRIHAQYTLVLGENEWKEGRAKLKSLGIPTELDIELSAVAIATAFAKRGDSE